MDDATTLLVLVKCLACILDELYDAAIELEQSGELDQPEQDLVRQVKLIVEEYRK